jgi:hypothetical protein
MIIGSNVLTKKKFKVIICGSGPAGISLALDLEKNKIDCLIIESGDKFYTEKAQKRYEGDVTGNFPDNLSELRLSQFGGTSGHWGGTCGVLDNYDFKKWPINKIDLDPFLDDSCKILNIKNQFREKEIADDLKIIEFKKSDVTFFDKYFEHIKKSKYINLALNSSIFGVKTEDGRVKQIIIKSEVINYIDTNILVLACGGIENSRLLLWFRENNNSISNKMPIGNFWMEHPFKVIGTGVGNFKKIKNFFYNEFDSFYNFRNWGNFTVSVSPTEKAIQKKKILNSCAFLTIHDRDNQNIKDTLKDLLCVAPKISTKMIDLFNKKLLCGITISSSWEQDPEFKNKISLINTKDNIGIPNISLNYQISKKTLDTSKVMTDLIGNIFIKEDLGRIAHNDIYNLDNFISDAGYHHLGGTRMGNDENTSVVDKNLKVHGLKNMFICGSSIFPTGGHTNPTLSIIQLTLRLSTHLKNMISLI